MVRLLRSPGIQCVEREVKNALRKALFIGPQIRSDKHMGKTFPQRSCEG